MTRDRRTAYESRYGLSLAFLSSQVGARSAQLFAERLAPLDVNPREFAVLSNLASSEEPLHQQAVADALGMHRNNVVALIDALEAKGWVRRERDSADRRAYVLVPTRAGLRKLGRANAIVEKLDVVLAASLTTSEVDQLRDLLARVAGELGLAPGVHPHLAARPRHSP